MEEFEAYIRHNYDPVRFNSKYPPVAKSGPTDREIRAAMAMDPFYDGPFPASPLSEDPFGEGLDQPILPPSHPSWTQGPTGQEMLDDPFSEGASRGAPRVNPSANQSALLQLLALMA